MSKEKAKVKTIGLTDEEKKLRAASREFLKAKLIRAIEESIEKEGVYDREIVQVLLEISVEMNAGSLKSDYDKYDRTADAESK